jgi:hypothetical protein
LITVAGVPCAFYPCKSDYLGWVKGDGLLSLNLLGDFKPVGIGVITLALLSMINGELFLSFIDNLDILLAAF